MTLSPFGASWGWVPQHVETTPFDSVLVKFHCGWLFLITWACLLWERKSAQARLMSVLSLFVELA